MSTGRSGAPNERFGEWWRSNAYKFPQADHASDGHEEIAEAAWKAALSAVSESAAPTLAQDLATLKSWLENKLNFAGEYDEAHAMEFHIANVEKAVAALSAQPVVSATLPTSTPFDPEFEHEGTETTGTWQERCAALYQVIGAMATQMGVFETSQDVCNALDVACGRGDMETLLPWPKDAKHGCGYASMEAMATEEMIEAGYKAAVFLRDRKIVAAIWAAMLAASPTRNTLRPEGNDG